MVRFSCSFHRKMLPDQNRLSQLSSPVPPSCTALMWLAGFQFYSHFPSGFPFGLKLKTVFSQMLLYIKNGFVLFQNYGKKLEGGWHDDGRASGQVVISFCPSPWKIRLPFTSYWALFLSITPTISSGCAGHSLFNLGKNLGNLSFSWLADGEGRRWNSYHCNFALLSLLLSTKKKVYSCSYWLL